MTILVALLLLGIGRIPWPKGWAFHLRGSTPKWRPSVQSAYLQGQVGAQLPPHWMTRSVESVPIFQQNSTQADQRRVWLVKVWCNEELPLQLTVHPKDDFGRLQLVMKAVRKTGAEVLFEGHKEGLPMTAIRANATQLQALLNETHDLVEFVEEDSELTATEDGTVKEKDVNDWGTAHQSKRRSSLQDAPPSWGLDRIDQRGAVAGGHNASYRYHPKAGESVHVYVLDTGIRTSHKDFGGRAVRVLEVTDKGLHLCEDSEDKECAMDKNGHGTRIAGIVGGHRYGVAKSTTIHAIKVLDDEGHGSSWRLAAAFDWLLVNAEQPAVLVVASYVRGQLSAVSSAVDAATRAGITVVVAATDRGLTAHPNACDYTPGFAQSVLTIGATTRRDTQALTSSSGTCIDLLAPGEEVVTCGVSSDLSEAQLPPKRSSSALAAAHAAGAAALLLSEKPHLQASEVKQTLIATSTVGRLSQLHGSPDRLLNSLGEELEVPFWATEGMWSLVDGGKDRECGGFDADEDNNDFVIFRQVESLQSCKEKCEHSEETTGCAGISYSHEEEVCQIHVDLVRSSKQMTGYMCLRHEAPTTTRTSITTTSTTTVTWTSSTGSTTSRSSTTQTSFTNTRTSITTTAPYSKAWEHSQDLNCYWGAGGNSARNGQDFVGLLPLEDCLKECAKLPDVCEASLYQDTGGHVGNCWLRSQLVLPECVKVPGYSLWFSPAVATTLKNK